MLDEYDYQFELRVKEALGGRRRRSHHLQRLQTMRALEVANALKQDKHWRSRAVLPNHKSR